MKTEHYYNKLIEQLESFISPHISKDVLTQFRKIARAYAGGKASPKAEPELTKEGITKADESPEYSYTSYVEIRKVDNERRLVYGVVMEPMVKDTQGDTTQADEIEKAAHIYMIESRTLGLQHKAEVKDAEVVESYIAPDDFVMDRGMVKKGSWVMATYIANDAIWEAVKKGELTGYSIGGTAERVEA